MYIYVDTNAEPANYEHCVCAIIFPLQEKNKMRSSRKIVKSFSRFF